MKRTREEAAQTRAAILEAAEILFVERGYALVSLSDVARRAGCTRGAVYWYFKDKPNLLFALKEREKTPVQELAERVAADDALDPLASLMQNVIEYFTILEHNSQRRSLLKMMVGVSFEGMMLNDGKVPQRQLDQALLNALGGVFRTAKTRGQLNPLWSPEIAALSLHALVSGLITDWLRNDTLFSIGREGSTTVRLFIRALYRQECVPPGF